jgi:hypothetical protein
MTRVGKARKTYGFSERGRWNVKWRMRKRRCRAAVMRCVRVRVAALRVARVLAAFWMGVRISGVWYRMFHGMVVRLELT